MRRIIRNILEPLRIVLFDITWRKYNHHNFTHAGCRFDRDKVYVGTGTYGKINVYSYNNKHAGKLIVGNYCSIANSAIFLTAGNHDYSVFSTYPFHAYFFNEDYNSLCRGGGTNGDILIDDDVWLCERVTILSGSHIGQGAIVAAGAVVSGEIPPYSIAGGIPAKVIKYRFQEDIISELLKVDFKKIDKEFIYNNKGNIVKQIKNINDLEWLKSAYDEKIREIEG